MRLNGEYLYTDVRPFIENGSTLAPVRFISEALHAQVEWDQNTQTALIYSGNTTVEIPVGKSYAYINGKKQRLATPAQLIEGRALLPVRFLAEALDFNVAWDDQYRNVEISKDGVTPPESLIDPAYSHDELVWLSRIIYAESRGESFLGQVAVGDVILNRVESDQFPDDIYSVIFDRRYGVQFEPILNGSIYNDPLKTNIGAAKTALRNPSVVGSSLYFFNPATAQSTWISKNRPYFTTIGNHQFHL